MIYKTVLFIIFKVKFIFSLYVIDFTKSLFRSFNYPWWYIFLFKRLNKDSKSIIPKIIHLTWKTTNLPDQYLPLFENIKKLHPKWEIKV